MKPGSVLVILLHEIYGVNEHMRVIEQRIIQSGMDVVVPNLLGRASFNHEEENEAYSYFMQHVGFQKGVHEVQHIVQSYRDAYEQIYVIGFSVGATIAWLASGLEVDGVIGYYGSRIRDYTKVDPSCRVKLFFPRHEASFDVRALLNSLSAKNKVSAVLVDADHGFMNPFSDCYNIEASEFCWTSSMEMLKNMK